MTKSYSALSNTCLHSVELMSNILHVQHNNLIFHDTVDTTHVEKEMEQLECVLDGSYGNQDTVDQDDEEEWSWDWLVSDNSDEDNN